MPFFKDGKMYSTKKSVLKNLSAVECERARSNRIYKKVDRCALLWCCDWERNETFEKIFEKYPNFLSYHSFDIIVFDGYAPSTKGKTHQKRYGSFGN